LKRLLPLLIAVASSVAWSGPLTGLENTALEIQELDAGAAKCGIDKRLVEAAIRAGLHGSEPNIVPRSMTEKAVLVAQLSTLHLQDGRCVSAVTMKCQTTAAGTTSYSTSFGGVVSVWDDQGIYSGSRRGFERLIAGAVRDMTKRFAAAWRRDNR
jgi:hypothetical protein